ncbi:MAG: TonB-dependent receptor [Candidatus Krumholzibacteriota bacterium]|nr:TonB-dependent receptor [Candidatus Krumholzibacteriota bacterium]
MRKFVLIILQITLLTPALAPFAPAGCAEASDKRHAVPDTVFLLPEIIVEAESPETGGELFRHSGFVGIIDADGTRTPSQDASRLLSNATGIRVKQYGGLGSFATASIRGSSSSHVQVYLDGVPLSDPCTGVSNLSDIAIGNIDRIEVYRGFSPISFGSSSIGGAINFVTAVSSNAEGRSAPAPVDISSSVTAGSFGTRKGALRMSSAAGPLTLNCFGGYAESEGNFTFLDDNATPLNISDDRVATRLNSDFSRWNLSLRADIEIPELERVSLNFDSFEREGGVPGTGANQSSKARIKRRRRITYLRMKPEPLFSRRLRSEFTAFHSWTAELFDDPLGDISLVKQKTDNRILSYGGNMKGSFFFSSLPLSADLFLEGRKERFTPKDFLPDLREGPDRLRKNLTAAISGNLSLFKDRAVLSAGTKYLWSQSEFYDEAPFPWMPPTPQGEIENEYQSPRAGFKLHLAKSFTIKGNIGRHYRTPTFFELFGNTGSVTGDGNLKPEKGLNRDIGAVLSKDRFMSLKDLYLEMLYFDNEITNLILFFPNSQRTVKPENIGSARIKGCEVSGSLRLSSLIGLSGNYTYIDGKNTSPIPYYNGNELASTPAHEASFTVTLSARRCNLAWKLHYIGSNYLDRANMDRVPEREIHSISLETKPLGERFSITLEGRNLTNNQIRDISGFPLPGRSFYMTIKFNTKRGNDDEGQ